MDHMEKDCLSAENKADETAEQSSVIQCVASPVEPEPPSSSPPAEPMRETGEEQTGEPSGARAKVEAKQKGRPSASEKKPAAVRLDAFLRRHKVSRGMAAGLVLIGTALLTTAVLLLRSLLPPGGTASGSDLSSLSADSKAFSSAPPTPPETGAGGLSSSETKSGLSSTYQPAFAEGAKPDKYGVYVIMDADVKRWHTASIEQLLYDPDTAVSSRLYFEPDSQGGYTQHIAAQYTESKDEHGNSSIYRIDVPAGKISPIVVAYHSYGGRYYFDFTYSHGCYLAAASADGNKLILEDTTGASSFPLLFEPDTQSLCPVANISYPDAEPADGAYDGAYTVWAGDCAMSADGRFLAYMSNRRQMSEDWSGKQENRSPFYDLWVWDAQTGKESILKKDINWALYQWHGHTLYGEQALAVSQGPDDRIPTEYFSAALPEGKIRELEDPWPASSEDTVFSGYSYYQYQHVVLRAPEGTQPADSIQIRNLENQRAFTFSLKQLEGIQLSLNQTPVLSDDGDYMLCPLLGEERFASPSLYLAVIRTDDGAARLYRLPHSVPTTASLRGMLGDQVYMSWDLNSYEDLTSSQIGSCPTELIQFSLAPLPQAGS